MQLPFLSGYSQQYLAGSHAQCWEIPGTAEERNWDSGHAQPQPQRGASWGQGVPDGGCDWGAALRVLPGSAPSQSSGRLQRAGKSFSQDLSPSLLLPVALAPLSFLSRDGWCRHQTIPVPWESPAGNCWVLLPPTPQNLPQGARTMSVGAAASPKPDTALLKGVGSQARLPRQG